ncbi:hypothetical protein [Peribacillus frigoritolerans]|uniref:Uncharacterized protein n=1 Tax=Peribacillus castrilensis TaxID=2897690 RepID=A0AAW9NP34_9BACI|nr:hypothetical protein [Peribacillus castrilensis]
MDIRDQDSKQGIDWSEIFFRLHHYCNLNKFEIFEYTLPQIIDLMRMTNKHIEFEVQLKGSPFGMFGGGSSSSDEGSSAGEGDYQEITADNVNELARILGGA